MEVLLVMAFGVCSSLILGLLIGLLTGWVVTSFVIVTMGGSLASIQLGPSYIAKKKHGKPNGYVIKKLKIDCSINIGLETPYIFHHGAWHTKKMIRRKDV